MTVTTKSLITPTVTNVKDNDTKSELTDCRIEAFKGLISPVVLENQISPLEKTIAFVKEGRKEIENVLDGVDDRLIVIVGPCSIHDIKAALDFAQRLKVLKDKHSNELCIVMRVYFEKPRSTIGWKGLINDPDLNGTCNVNKGLTIARMLLHEIVLQGIPTAVEYLETYTPQYIGDLVSWAAIGARTTPCSLHQSMSSGLSVPVGFKNLTDGNIEGAVDACQFANNPQTFLGMTHYGSAAFISTDGNPYSHVILRGGNSGTNYDEESIMQTNEAMKSKGMHTGVIVDCSHGNSSKKHKNQIIAGEYLADLYASGKETGLKGVMIESFIEEGNQKMNTVEEDGPFEVGEMDQAGRFDYYKSLLVDQSQDTLKKLTYGKSVTDACIDIADTEALLEKLADSVKSRRIALKK